MGLIRAGDTEGWNHFVRRYQRRLLAFARGRVDQPETAQDLVQETLLAFLRSLSAYRDEGNLESFLFRILRRRIIDHYRSAGQRTILFACDITEQSSHSEIEQVASHELTPSHYVRREEQVGRERETLSHAIKQLTSKLRDSERFRELKIAEGLFYAGLRNQDLADLIDATPAEIGVIKHRMVKKLSEIVTDQDSDSISVQETDLRVAWESHRPSCPKRSTLGKYTLSILPEEWDDFVRFHVETLGCRFCNANLAELRAATESTQESSCLFESTIGFLPKPGNE